MLSAVSGTIVRSSHLLAERAPVPGVQPSGTLGSDPLVPDIVTLGHSASSPAPVLIDRGRGAFVRHLPSQTWRWDIASLPDCLVILCL